MLDFLKFGLIYQYRFWIVVISIVVSVTYLRHKHDKYYNLFSNLDWWKGGSVKKSLFISIIVFGIFMIAWPNLQMLIENSLGSVSDPGNTAEVQVGKAVAQVIGIEPTYWLLGVMNAIVGFVETVIFIGIYLDYIDMKTQNKILAILLSASFFGIYHIGGLGMNPPMILHTFLAGVVFGALYYKIGILGVTIVHSGYNFGLMIFVSLGVQIPNFVKYLV